MVGNPLRHFDTGYYIYYTEECGSQKPNQYSNENGQKDLFLEEDEFSSLEKNLKNCFVTSLEDKSLSSLGLHQMKELEDYVSKIGKVDITCFHEEKKGVCDSTGIVEVNDFYDLLGIKFKGNGFRYDSRAALIKEIGKDFFDRLSHYFKIFHIEGSGEKFEISPKSS